MTSFFNHPKRVYFIKPVGADGPIKIGCSRWPDDRLLNIANWSPVPIEIMASGVGSHELERFIHRMFAATRSHKEWFHATPALTSSIARVADGMDIADAFGLVAYIPKSRFVGGEAKYRLAATPAQEAAE